MEDGTIINGTLSSIDVNDHVTNGVATPSMANFLEGTVSGSKEEQKEQIEAPQVNGDNFEAVDDSCSNESDALVIDESGPRQRKVTRKKSQKQKVLDETSKNSDVIPLPHSNPFFNESLFELSQQHHNVNSDSGKVKKTGKRKPKPKLKEYAQYLGLQPTVQFRCSKCGQAGFESLQSLQEHLIQCTSVQNVGNKSPSSDSNCAGFKLTRRVFLCSACGTYYENWNLYMHMLEFHRRYICLYCLGMFSILDDLCQHIQSRHNLEPGRKNSLDEFFSTYSEPCYVVCCECNKLFNEQDNFFYHNCVVNKKKLKTIKTHILPENHITGDSITETSTESKKSSDNSAKTNTEPAIEQEKAEMPPDKETEAKENVLEKEEEASAKVNEKQDISMEIDKKNESLVENDISVESQQTEECAAEPTASREENSEEKSIETVVENLSTEVNNEMDLSDDSLSDKVNSMESYPEHSSEDNRTLESENKSQNEDVEVDEEPVETRKVPKLSLKLPKSFLLAEPEVESDDSEKLTMEVDQIESENENELENENEESKTCATEEMLLEQDTSAEHNNESLENDESNHGTSHNEDISEPQLQVADKDIPIVEIELDQPLDKIDVRILLQKCLKSTVTCCIYCNHARKIAVNGKQLGLHAIAQHRYSSVVKSITAEELIPESFNTRIQESLEELENVFFNLESSASDEAVTFSHLFECFQCHYSTTVHKELYLHNRKFHSKNLLLCIMCKSNFYSYSELICHLCPGVYKGIYILDFDLKFRCCMCVSEDLPSAFRLMVHLRKRHNVCDVCLEMCHNQYRLSNHVWKHKLHHFCYRCGIAYRNKPDITRHLFWKHGTESVMCKKCLQKKWPHMYHFCVPPNSFTCDECSLILTRAVSLKVHKRLHSNETKHECPFEGCTEKFISKKIMLKHERGHWDPPEEEVVKEEEKEEEEEEEKEVKEVPTESKEEVEDLKEEPPKPKPKIDVYDLPELNLSESDSSDSEPESTTKKFETNTEEQTAQDKPKVMDTLPSLEHKSSTLQNVEEITRPCENDISNTLSKPEDDNSTDVIQNIWNNFQNYQASREKLDHMFSEPEKPAEPSFDIPIPMVEVEEPLTAEIALRDHDYCVSEPKADTSIIEVEPALTLTERVDHDYCFHKEEGVVADKAHLEEEIKPEAKEVKKRESSSSSSSDSGSSCTCGSNCSCSSSSGSSSSSSDSSDSDSSTEEGRQRQQVRRQKRREKNKEHQEGTAATKSTPHKSGADDKNKCKTNVDLLRVPTEITIHESDLDTTESETDEEFYDREPHKIAKKLMEEKRMKLIEHLGPNNIPNGSFMESTSRPPTPPAGTLDDAPKPKKKKLKKRKKKKEKRQAIASSDFASSIPNIPPYYQQFHQQQQQQPPLPPIKLTLKNTNSPKNSPVRTPGTPPMGSAQLKAELQLGSRRDSSDSSLRASKRRRVPNKFYGYSSDEEEKKGVSSAKWRKVETSQPAPQSPLTVPPITIKTPQASRPTVEPISIRLPAPQSSSQSDFKVRQRPPRVPPIRLLSPRPPPPPPRPLLPPPQVAEPDSETDTNESDAEQQAPQPAPPPAVGPPAPSAAKPQPQLYCYCRCPYDEVSEMIGCDSSECEIEWFHFECVGIMVPPKGQWFCPDCRKKMHRRAMMGPH